MWLFPFKLIKYNSTSRRVKLPKSATDIEPNGPAPPAKADMDGLLYNDALAIDGLLYNELDMLGWRLRRFSAMDERNGREDYWLTVMKSQGRNESKAEICTGWEVVGGLGRAKTFPGAA